MATTDFGIVYATNSKIIRRVILPQDGSAVEVAALTNGTHALANGESILVSGPGPHDLSAVQSLVQAATGVAPSSALYAVVDATNTVTSMALVDPALDTPPAGTSFIAAYPGVGPGCTYNAATGLFSTPQSMQVEARGGQPVLVLPQVIPKPNVAVA